VEPSVLEELREQFDRLDMTMSDSLTKQDLILMAKLRRNRKEQIPEVNGTP
jgi:iron-sulfur cluster repair protein YtfE (RIC family)